MSKQLYIKQFSLGLVSMSKIVPFQIIQFTLSTQFKCKNTVLLSKTFLFQTIQFSQTVLIQTIQFNISRQFRSILPIDSASSGTITPAKSGLVGDGNEGMLCIPQSSGASPSDCLLLYLGHSLVGGLTPLQRSSLCILHPQPTGQERTEFLYIYIYV